VNYNTDASGNTESYLWNGTAWVDLGIGGAAGMNDSDSVVGNGASGYWVYANSVLDTAPGYAIPGGGEPFANAINNSGEMVGECPGWNGCVFGPDASLLLWGATQGTAPPYAINAGGATCGANGIERFAVWSNTGAQIFSVNLDNWAACTGLDDYGTAVGWGGDAEGVGNGYIADPINGTRSLNSLTQHEYPKGHHLLVFSAQAISDTGFIAATCTYGPPYYGEPQFACLLTPNPALILKDSIAALAKGDPECIQCTKELEPEGAALPSSFEGLSTEKKNKAVATVEKIESQVLVLRDGDRISEAVAVLLLHDVEMALRALDRPRG
jgi:hypothetical protein